MIKKKRFHIYLNQFDNKKLTELSNKRKETKSAIIRKLIHIEKYAKTLEQIEINNHINSEFLYQIAKLGNNINQIAYHLNIDITSHDKAKDNLIEILTDFKNVLNMHKEKIQKNKIYKDTILNSYQTIRDNSNDQQ